MQTMTTDERAALADDPGHPGSMAPGDHHDADDHGDDAEHDDHAHGEDTLGPVDVFAWGAGLLGVVLGLAMTACFYLATLPPGGG